MEPARQILILSLVRPRLPTGGGSEENSPLRFTTSSLRWLSRVVLALGYQWSTVSKALSAAVGRHACLTIDGWCDGQSLLIAEQLANMRLSASWCLPVCQPGSLGAVPADAWDRIKVVADAGIEIGSMGAELHNLSTLGSSEQRQLIEEGQSALADRLGRRARLFAYPFGAYDATTVSLVRQAGFEAAVTLHRGISLGAISEDQRFHLPRLPLTGSTLADGAMVVQAIFTAGRHGHPSRPEDGDALEAAAATH